MIAQANLFGPAKIHAPHMYVARVALLYSAMTNLPGQA